MNDFDEEKFLERLKSSIKNESVLGVSRRAGISQSVLRRYLDGSLPGIDKAVALAKATGVSLEWLVTGNDPQLPAATPDLAGVPLMEPKASAGDGLIALGTQVKNYISLDPALLHQLGLSQAESFLIEASGDSMEPTIHSGEFLLCSSSVRFKKPGDGLYIIRLGEAVLVKRIRVLRADQIEIISDNKILYPSTTHTFTEGSTEFAILGKVSYILCKRV